MNAIDFFCGAGIGALGFERAGIKTIQAFDNKKYAVDTYNTCVSPVAEVKDIALLSPAEVKDAQIHISTPVCKPFSVAGNGKGEEDEVNGNLFNAWLQILGKKKPEVFLVENVDGLVNKKHKPFFDWIIKTMQDSGYRVDWRVLDAYDFGVPQHRNRVFIIGRRSRGDIIFPAPTGHRTIRSAIGDLPEPGLSGIRNHYGHGIRPDEAPFVDAVPFGGNWKDLPSEKMKKAFMKGAYASGGGRTGYLRKVAMDKPAYAITSTMFGKFNAQILDLRDKYGADYAGTPLCRRYTVRECLRLQTVPDTFYFDDSIPLLKQYERCSGIPTELAFLLGQGLVEMLK
jgi:DNA (cytosine-5)-methyltransferase 1